MNWYVFIFITSTVIHINVAENIVKRHVLNTISNPQYKTEVSKPLHVPCSYSMCTGPLAEIYCHGQILATSWQFGLQKTCPGDRMKKSAKEIIGNFEKLKYPIKRETFEFFCSENFEEAEYLTTAEPGDWVETPSFLQYITNAEMKQLATEVHQRWKRLARSFNEDVFQNPDNYPLWPVKNMFIVPGGRFDVYFYWDTYWIIKGLLISDMTTTAEGMIDNFADLIAVHGFIPNSGNIQLSRRSQPPLFSHMVWDYTEKTGHFKKEWIDQMRQELHFWETNKTITVRDQTLFAYKAISDCPRPENFLGDYNIAGNSSTPNNVWRSIASACESGWDFSSRWMEQGNQAALGSIHTDKIIPVDLNAFMALNYKIMYSYFDHFGEYEQSAIFKQKFEKLTNAMQAVLWDKDVGCWFDFDLTTNNKNFNFYPSNVFPLMIPGFEQYSSQVASYVKKSGSMDFEGGVPTTMPVSTSQQWDFPNVWAPNQHLLIRSFIASNNSYLQDQARSQSKKFIKSVFNGLFVSETSKTLGIWEKYDARSATGSPGGGGEYLVQEGFGWTNGAVLDLIWHVRNEHFHPVKKNGSTQMFGSLFQEVFIIVSWITVAFIFFAFLGKAVIWTYDRRQQREQETNETRGLLDEDDDFDTV